MIKSRVDLKATFKQNAVPTQDDFANVFDTYLHKTEDKNVQFTSLQLGEANPVNSISNNPGLSDPNSENVLPTQQAVKSFVENYPSSTETFSLNNLTAKTLKLADTEVITSISSQADLGNAAPQDNTLPTQKAVKSYVDATVKSYVENYAGNDTKSFNTHNLTTKTLTLAATEITTISSQADLGNTAPQDNTLPTQKAVKSYVDANFAPLNSSHHFTAGQVTAGQVIVQSSIPEGYAISHINCVGKDSYAQLQLNNDMYSGTLFFNGHERQVDCGANALVLRNNGPDGDIKLITKGNGKINFCLNDTEAYSFTRSGLEINLADRDGAARGIEIYGKQERGWRMNIEDHGENYQPGFQLAWAHKNHRSSNEVLLSVQPNSGSIRESVVHIRGELKIDGDITCSNIRGNFVSDQRLKENIHDLTKSTSLQLFKQLKLHRYNFIEACAQLNEHYQGEKVGVIAQELEEIYPQAVQTSAEFTLRDGKILNDVKKIDITELHYHQFNITQYLIDQVERLTEEVKQLKEKLGS